MKVNVAIKPGLRIQAFYLFFIVSNIQTGTGIMGVPSFIFKEAQHDGWISVIIAGIFMHLITFVFFLMLQKYENTDILGIQVDIFGKWIGKLLGTLFIIYVFASLVTVLINYIQVVQVFIFPLLSPWILGILLLFLVYYAMLGGIRVAVGVSFTFFFLSLWLAILMYKPATQIDFGHFVPILEASPKELLLGARATSYSYLGLEVLLFIYPFIDNKKKAQVSAQLGVLMTTLLIFIATFISIGVIGGNTLEKYVWPVLLLYKLIEYEVIERFDLIVVAAWMMVILPIMLLLTWMIIYGVKRLYRIPQKKTLYIVIILLFICGGTIQSQFLITKIIDVVAQVGFWLVYVYPIALLPVVLIKKKLEKKRGQNQ